ncbi:hypothetical protein [Rhizobium mesoamericanum]|uniref:hypothetical protein n=1 Tax=Rhizobium mesoamericanum TaxID=1079800 RepID=UPI00138AEF81|nr:hypothetical protein [Rhizobium mesoamericanum]
MTDIELKRAVAGKFWKREQAATALPNEDDIRENIEQDIALFEDKDPSAEATLLAQARAIVRETGLKIKLPTDTRIGQPAPEFQASSDLTKLIGLFRRADVEHLKRALDRMSGRYGDHAHDPLFQDINSVSPPPAVGEGVALGEAIQRIEIDPVRAHLGDTAEAKYVVTFRTMKEVLGTDRPLGADDHL